MQFHRQTNRLRKNIISTAARRDYRVAVSPQPALINYESTINSYNFISLYIGVSAIIDGLRGEAGMRHSA